MAIIGPAAANLPARDASKAAAGKAPQAAAPMDWRFDVLLDGKPVGQHRFTVTSQGQERRVNSTASFDVKWLGFTVYRYRHEARERWQGDCLAELQARTDANGRETSVSARLEGGALQVEAQGATQALPPCTMTFAYWSPALRRQSLLLNPQTGRDEAVQMVPVGTGLVDVRGAAVQAEHWRLTGAESPIDLWYAADGEWLALDAMVQGRRLSYRLR
ncbi:DUF6134 family protein [Aquincola sp. MAHUQ-54]|uniref:DUF6134 family protein n=1 Tax=Aquincola agrisoli TaxID=3119538 RepID=A0AAW9QKL3_9BURK